MADKVIRKHQTVLDLALQMAGDATALFTLALLNGIAPTDIVVPGTVLRLPEVVNAQVVKNYLQNGIEPATMDDESTIPGGIGYMGIAINFKVS